jgi:ADP-ribose pyrophosphatase YjhB (NUDIX family)
MNMDSIPQTPLIGAYLLLVIDGKVLLSKRNDSKYKGEYDGKYSLVAGHTDKGETVIEAVIREAFEEANIEVKAEDLEVKVVLHRPNAHYKGKFVDIIDFFILAKTYGGELKNNEIERCSELAFYPLNDLPKETIPYVREALRAFQKGDVYIVHRS